MGAKGRIACVAVAAATLLGVAAGAAFGADTGWMVNNACRVLTVGGCGVTQAGSTGYVDARENSPCSGSVGVQSQYKTYNGSPTYTSSIRWGASYARVDAPITLYVKVYH